MAINAQRVKGAEYVRSIFSATPEVNTKFEDTLKPEYWAHVAAKFHPTDRIEVLAEDGSWFAELFVVSCGRNWAKVCQLRFVELSQSTENEAPESKFFVQWKGQTLRHAVLRRVDKEIVKAEFPTAAEARKWLDDYETNVAKA